MLMNFANIYKIPVFYKQKSGKSKLSLPFSSFHLFFLILFSNLFCFSGGTGMLFLILLKVLWRTPSFSKLRFVPNSLRGLLRF